jgi:hypothetical protein
MACAFAADDLSGARGDACQHRLALVLADRYARVANDQAMRGAMIERAHHGSARIAKPRFGSRAARISCPRR